jgi:hypothetical protein
VSDASQAPVVIAYYVTGHGFGHASRAQAVIEELLAAHPGWRVELRTTAPLRAFPGLGIADREPPETRVCRVEVDLDPGVVQRDSFDHDLSATAEAWLELSANAEAIIAREVDALRAAEARLVLSDVSPLACAIASAAGLPALVVGNFTWDWILDGYRSREPRLEPVIAHIRGWYGHAETYLRLPLSPAAPSICGDSPPIFAREQRVGFIARRRREDPASLRARIGVAPDETLVLLSFGGFGVTGLNLDCVDGVAARGVRVVWEQPTERTPDLLSIAGRGIRYTDLIAAADVVVSKPGFGIIAECVAQRGRLLWVPRGDFREAPLLQHFLEHEWPSRKLPAQALGDGRWLAEAIELAATPRPPAGDAHGAEQVRRHVERALAGSARRRLG